MSDVEPLVLCKIVPSEPQKTVGKLLLMIVVEFIGSGTHQTIQIKFASHKTNYFIGRGSKILDISRCSISTCR